MITEVVMPQMGADMQEGTVLRWMKAEGAPVERGEIIAEIETDKANVEIEAFGAGVFRKAIAKEGDVVPVGTIIAVIAAPDDDITRYESGPAPVAPAATAAETAPASPAPAAAPAPAPAPSPPPPPPPAPAEGERLRISPVARRMAEERGIDVNTLTGSGPDGRILRRDVEAAQEAGPAAAPAGAPMRAARPAGEDVVEDIPLTRMRQTIARRMVQSKQEAPHYYLAADIDMAEAMQYRLQAIAAMGDAPPVSVNDVIIQATARTLTEHPKFNAWWADDHLQTHSQINVAIAVALEEGLVVPAMFDVSNKGLAQISAEARDLAVRARNGRLRPEEYAAGTFSISNLGAFGVDILTPIINPPQVAVLGIGAARDQAVVRDGEIVVRTMMTVVLSADHRATDGAEGARFLQTLRRYLEAPALMLL